MNMNMNMNMHTNYNYNINAIVGDFRNLFKRHAY